MYGALTNQNADTFYSLQQRYLRNGVFYVLAWVAHQCRWRANVSGVLVWVAWVSCFQGGYGLLSMNGIKNTRKKEDKVEIQKEWTFPNNNSLDCAKIQRIKAQTNGPVCGTNKNVNLVSRKNCNDLFVSLISGTMIISRVLFDIFFIIFHMNNFFNNFTSYFFLFHYVSVP